MTTSRLRERRRAKGLKQAELGALVGVTQETISAYENGEKMPRVETLKRLAEALGCEMGDIL